MRTLRLLSCILALAASCRSQERPNPFGSGHAAEEGATLFQLHCSYCHGASGKGGRGADLTTGEYRHGGSDPALYSTIRNGIPGTEMPPVRVTDDEVWKMVAFVKRLGSAGLLEKATGDPAAGRAIYEGTGRCTTCHSIGGQGGSLGPELSDVGRRRGLRYLEESLITPEADVAIPYRAIRVVTKSGQTIAGIRLNEDDISVQLRDEQNNLRSFVKNDLREIRRDKPSLMPAYGSALSKKEIEDVVSYLSSLRSPQ